MGGQRKSSIITRLTLMVVGILTMAVLVAGSMALFEQHRQIKHALEAKAASLVQVMAQVSPLSILSLNFVEMNNNAKKVVMTDEEVIYTVIINAHGIALASFFKQKDPTVTARVRHLVAANKLLDARQALKQSGRILEITAPILAGEKQIGTAVLGVSFDRMRRALMLQIAMIGTVLVIIIGSSITLLIVVLRKTLRPVQTLTSAAMQISTGDLNVALTGTDRTDELGVLSRAFESMAGQLKGLITRLEQRVAERTAQLTMAKEQAEAANRSKSIFLASMSHELRTPLNAVLGFSQLMKNSSGISREHMQSLDIINRSGEHLLNLINNVLEISKIESGRVELEQSRLDLHQLMQEMTSLMHVRAHEKGLVFILEQSADFPRQVAADAGKLRQILINLIGNAIKYTRHGGVTLRARAVRKENAGPAGVAFEVEDTGPGIPREDWERIFSPFVQLADRPSSESGTGLGLSICKQYVEMMGGTIKVESVPGKGSVFRFEIPVVMLSPEDIPGESPRGRVIGLAEGQPRYRLLIAEDQPDNRLLLRKLLEPLGFDLREAVNGQEAVAIFEQWHPHLIWMDIRMPVMDGMEATRQIKATDAGAQTRIVAVTAHALEEERRKILTTVCDDFIRKPYRYAEVLDALTRNLGVRFVYEEETPSAGGTLPLTAAALADLPPELLNELEQALVRIDIGAVNRTIEAIQAQYPSQADALGAVAGDLQFGRILRMIRAALVQTVQTGPETRLAKNGGLPIQRIPERG